MHLAAALKVEDDQHELGGRRVHTARTMTQTTTSRTRSSISRKPWAYLTKRTRNSARGKGSMMAAAPKKTHTTDPARQTATASPQELPQSLTQNPSGSG